MATGMKLASVRQRRGGWKQEFHDIVRGVCGGFLFGIPILYTMEVWWIGSYAQPPMMLGAIALSFVVVFLLNRTEGFRTTGGNHDGWMAVMDSVEALAIGLVCATLVLILLREVNGETSQSEIIGKIVFEGVPFTLGVALANQFLGENQEGKSHSAANDQPQQRSRRKQGELNATLSDIGATLIGAIVIAFNIAPTDEIPMLTAAIEPPWLLLLMAASLLISYGIVFEAGFSNQQKRRQQKGIFQRPLSETVMSYLVSVLAAMLMLWFFQKLALTDPWIDWLEQSLVLGLPATIGGAAGRLAV